jgi:uncharacterized damage-inducible protein DinB
MRPEIGTYPHYYENYIPLVKENNLRDALLENEKETFHFFDGMAEHMGEYAYQDGKWTIKQILNHLIDTERIFAYRALRFARKDEQQTLSFEQDDYVANAATEQRSLKDLLDEFLSVRKASISLFGGLSQDALLRAGQTAAGKATVSAIGFTICGHNLHHISIIKERYLKK